MFSLPPWSLSPLAEHYHRSVKMDPMADGLEWFVAQCPDLSRAQLVELLLVDQALEWQQGPGTVVEDYLRRFPALADQRQAVLELVYGEIRAVHALGLPIDAEAYGMRFPDLAEPLRRQLELSAWLRGADGGGGPADS
jgi:hypothetical protein